MSRLSVKTVDRYLKDYGWSFHRAEQGCWVTGWQGEGHAFPLIIELTETWVSFTVSPLMKLGIEWEHWPEVMRYLLELNLECKLVKLGIDEFGDVGISIQLLANEMSYESFCDALGILGHYAEHCFDDLYRYLSGIGFEWKQSATLLS